ncbi:DUF1015 domain-containing protein [Kribbella sp. NBC_01245]|uniref:DUF1015 domain-containing protein n=1 Tax=Kribbella sp. NBC_01245 TaxID=2903578 RepID=UPI002E2B2ADA|nr:DUF1015 domain-containing protein [Kribbella sp. NBC_01245]
MPESLNTPSPLPSGAPVSPGASDAQVSPDAHAASGAQVSRPLRLEPLRAWRFVAGRVSTLGAVTSPPYDVLEPALVRRLTDSDLHNMVRLILPRDQDLGPSRYDQAAVRLTDWQHAGVVVQDAKPALYVYEQRLGDAFLCGLIGALGLDPGGHVVLPHEDTMPNWVDDRFTLMEATDADLEPILLAYTGGGAASDAIDEARAGVPWLVADSENGATHTIWRIDSPTTLAAIAADLATREALIADGHHRYAAYLERNRREPDRPGTDLGLAMLVDHGRHPLTLDAIHRTVPGLSLETVLSRTPEGWRVVPGRQQDDAHRLSVFDGTSWLTLYRTDARTSPAAVAKPEVSLLHEELFPAWGVDPEPVGFHHRLADALAQATVATAVIELDPPRLDQVLSTAAHGARLPQKATSFGPKPRTGLLFRTL